METRWKTEAVFIRTAGKEVDDRVITLMNFIPNYEVTAA